MTSIEAVLPANVQAHKFAECIILVGPELDMLTFKEIMNGLPESPDKKRIIGWKRVGRLQTQRERRP